MSHVVNILKRSAHENFFNRVAHTADILWICSTNIASLLHHLQWLSLHSNDIDEWPSLPSKPNLRSMFLGDNRVSHLSDGAFSNLHNLTSLDLDQNCIVEVDRHAFPTSLQTLSLSNNLMMQVPTAALHNLRNLTWLQIGGNLIEQLPRPFRLPVKQLHKLDLSHNLLTRLPSAFMNDSDVVTISNLHLEFNYIKDLYESTFKRLSPGKTIIVKQQAFHHSGWYIRWSPRHSQGTGFESQLVGDFSKGS
ncbi:hypothetical protein CEXT_98661 [Caerostris extrusa]|uniref:Uncharacterized protein n=1 Tax=Caerostris extrusa TaxID=172846 RepID=A0AAV4XHU9_CAEEX|nr:hypothetical protein CEXT_98661 [Caerostris extrusa]